MFLRTKPDFLICKMGNMGAASYIKLLERETKWTTISRACWKSVRKTRVHCGRAGTGRGMPRVKCDRKESEFLEVCGYSRPAVQSWLHIPSECFKIYRYLLLTSRVSALNVLKLGPVIDFFFCPNSQGDSKQQLRLKPPACRISGTKCAIGAK